jgi:soluble lytic murein transglycosylase-like protein
MAKRAHRNAGRAALPGLPLPSALAAARLAMALLVCSLRAGLGCSASLPECISPEKYRVLEAALAQGAPHLGTRERLGIAQAMAEAECTLRVDAFLLLAMAERESQLDPAARGKAGGIGLLQVRAATGEAVAKRAGWTWRGERTLLDGAANVRLAAAYLADLHGRFHSWEAALTAYNLGPARLRELVRSGKPATSPYARAVLRRKQRLRETLAGGAHSPHD